MSFKSDTAFDRTFDELFRWAEETGQKLYFWYVTLPADMPDSWAMSRWGKFLEKLKDVYRTEAYVFQGIRVCERQPGTGRLHFHCVVNKRVDGKRIARLAKHLGLGRIGFKDVYSKSGLHWYLREYLSRDAVKGSDRVIHRWKTMGPANWAVPVASVVVSNEYTRFLSRCRKQVFKGAKLPSWLAREVYNSIHIGYLEREEYILWYANNKFNEGWGFNDAFAPLSWPERYISQECAGIGRDDSLDGLVPFGRVRLQNENQIRKLLAKQLRRSNVRRKETTNEK